MNLTDLMKLYKLALAKYELSGFKHDAEVCDELKEIIEAMEGKV